MIRLFTTIFLLIAVLTPAYAKTNKGIKFLQAEEYTKAIQEFSKTLDDEESKEGIISAYVKRGDKNFQNKEYGKAANDYRSALFYAPDNIKIQNSLRSCEKKLKFKNTPKNHYYTAKLLKVAGEEAAANYEFTQSAKYMKTLEKNENKNNRSGKN